MTEEIYEEGVSKEEMKLLVDGRILWQDAKRLMHQTPKGERFWTYLEVLQEKVPWKEKILMRISECLYVVRKQRGERVVKCECGYEFGDYRANWKLGCLVYVRKTKEEVREVYTEEPALLDTGLVEIREFCCPGCLTLLGVEVVPAGYPIMWEIFPDLDSFYREWLGKPLDDESPEWFQDKTLEEVSNWLEK